jgi:hypothetical protein
MCIHCAEDSLSGQIDFTKQRILAPEEPMNVPAVTQPGIKRPRGAFPQEVLVKQIAAEDKKTQDMSSRERITSLLSGNLSHRSRAGSDIVNLPEAEWILLFVVPLDEGEEAPVLHSQEEAPVDCPCPMPRIAKLHLGPVDPTAKICCDCGKVWSELTDEEREQRAAPTVAFPREQLRRAAGNLFDSYSRGADKAPGDVAVYKRLVQIVSERMDPFIKQLDQLTPEAMESVFALLKDAKNVETYKEKYDILSQLWGALTTAFALTPEEQDMMSEQALAKAKEEFEKHDREACTDELCAICHHMEDPLSPSGAIDINTYTRAERRLIRKMTGLHPVYAALTTTPIYVKDVVKHRRYKKNDDTGKKEETTPELHIYFQTWDPDDEKEKEATRTRGHYEGVRGHMKYVPDDEKAEQIIQAWKNCIGKTVAKFDMRAGCGFIEDPITKEEMQVDIDCAGQGRYLQGLNPTMEQMRRFAMMEDAVSKLVAQGSHKQLEAGTNQRFKRGDVWYDVDHGVWREVTHGLGKKVSVSNNAVFARPNMPIGNPSGDREVEVFDPSY